MGDWDHPDDDEYARWLAENDQPDLSVIATAWMTIILFALTMLALIIIKEAL